MEENNHYEKLGLLYLGRELAISDDQPSPLPLLYKSKNLTTHGVIIGMTGSGKTGLGIGVIEEAIMDDIPSIIIDPKGDMANLLLTFPELRPDDFAPWVDPAEASRKNMSVDQLAQKTADTWKSGLLSWGQGAGRIRTLSEKANATVYTPGSSSGVPVSIVSGFSAPAPDVLSDRDTLNSLVGSTATSLLSLVDVDVDPLTSREHILVSSILLYYWRKAEDLSLESLIGAIVNPPFEKVGVFGLSHFFPQAERMKLAMLLNNVIASPSFSSWMTGEPLDIQRMLYGDDGRPRTSIFTIAHLGESERMFFVTLLLNAMIGWMRRQKGTSSLKALLYMDEIFGYFPPNRNPPSKKPMLLLLKQARAFGIGVVLSTQNPVDLDYKGLSNIGTWFVGRLQTSQDQNKVLDGIVGASDGVLDRATVKRLLSDMKGRQFLLTSAHLDEPLMFETRWVMSYLKGPISLQEIGKLMAGRQIPETTSTAEADEPLSGRGGSLNEGPALLSEGVEQRYFLPPLIADEMIFEPWLAGSATVRFYNNSRNIDELKQCDLRLYLDRSFTAADWKDAELLELDIDDCPDSAPGESSFYQLPETFYSIKNLGKFEKEFSDFLYQNERLELFRAPAIKLESRPGESEADFLVSVADHMREKKEFAAEKLLARFNTKRQRLEKKLDSSLMKIEKEKGDVTAKTTDTLLSIGTAVLGAFFGRKALSSTTITRTAGGIRKAGQVAKEKGDVQRAQAAASEIESQIQQLNSDQTDELEKLVNDYDPLLIETETFAIKPRRSDIFDIRLCLLWEMITPRR
jgi:hypothetical protein